MHFLFNACHLEVYQNILRLSCRPLVFTQAWMVIDKYRQLWNIALNFYLSCFRYVAYSTFDRSFLDLHCKVYVLGNSSLLSLPTLIGLYHIFIYHISYLLTIDCYILFVKIIAKCKKKDFVGWIIFYVRTVHLSQLIFLMLPLNVLLLLNGIDCYSSKP